MNSKKVLKIVVSILLGVGFIYTVYGTFFKGGPKFSSMGNGFSSMDERASTAGTDPLEIALDSITINLGEGKFSYLKTEISLKMMNKSTHKAAIQNRELIRRLVLNLASHQDGNKLETDRGKTEFKELIRQSIQNEIGLPIESVYFRNFVLAR